MRALIKINLKNLKSNFLEIKNKTNKNIIAVLKDNAYGHDLIHVAKLLSMLNVNMIALATFEEAISLRKNLIFTPILLFERCSYYRILSSYKITIAIQSLNHLKEVISSQYPLSIHLEIETGFNRFGILENEIEEALKLISNSKLKLTGIYTHIASPFSKNDQIKIFKSVLEKIPFLSKLAIHIRSSSYIDDNIEFENTIRVGLALYTLNNNQVMSINAPVLRCKKVNAGDIVSYNNEVIKEDGYVLTLGIGYGDGWKKDYQTLAYYKGNYLHQIGVTNMDALMLFSKTKIEENQYIELLGDHIKINDLLSIYNVSSYEFFSLLSSRIKKEFNT